jgi:hypothetical protein
MRRRHREGSTEFIRIDGEYRGGRRRPQYVPFLLCIADHDNGRFTIEGPMTDAEAWIREIIAARRAGREITCRAISGTAGTCEEAASAWMSAHGGARWPPGSIVSPAPQPSAATIGEVPGEGAETH